MKYTILSLTCLLCFTGKLLFAQNSHFTTTGTIEFEKKINSYAIIKKMITSENESIYASLLEAYKKNNPQFKVLKSTLTFGGNKTLYTPVAAENTDMFLGTHPMSNQYNIIYNDFVTGRSTSQKKVFEELFLVKDSTRKINWKITDETREILGYTCRRANAIILDSVYVVAFYTNEIAVSGGPESFSGLPGMILGVALPHDNVTWFATKVTDQELPPIMPPTKGKPVDNKGYRATLEKAFKNWGEYAKPYFLGFML